jgi:hypothetical protein
MTRFNILWGVLHGGSDKTTDWVRGTSEKLGLSGRGKAATALLPDKDDSVRGWLAETVIRAALLSGVADDIMALDPANTYSTPLSDPPKRLFTTRSNFQGADPFPVRITETPSDSWTYERTARFTPPGSFTPPSNAVYVDGSYVFTVSQPNGSIDSAAITFSSGSASLPFDGGTVRVSGVRYDWFGNGALDITYKALPRANPVELLSNRMKSDDFTEDAGELCLGLLKEYL